MEVGGTGAKRAETEAKEWLTSHLAAPLSTNWEVQRTVQNSDSHIPPDAAHSLRSAPISCEHREH